MQFCHGWMMTIAFIIFSSSSVPLIEGLCYSNPQEFEFSSFRRNWAYDLGIDSPSLWPTEPRLHLRFIPALGTWPAQRLRQHGKKMIEVHVFTFCVHNLAHRSLGLLATCSVVAVVARFLLVGGESASDDTLACWCDCGTRPVLVIQSLSIATSLVADPKLMHHNILSFSLWSSDSSASHLKPS